eukprot:gb/GECG01001055.1/.p1 GENE.gb/GECG01001055.1/~~gb/GECG01001055.1/.p1  ORF type:complete len:330 (+),score=6.16 gb/GECG01001055.1/:1-990(+)
MITLYLKIVAATCLGCASGFLHVAMLVAPVWFMCSYEAPSEYSDYAILHSQAFFALFYVVDVEIAGSTTAHQLDFAPSPEQTQLLTTKATASLYLFAIMKIQMIVSALLLVMLMRRIRQEIPISENRVLWKTFCFNWLACGILGILNQFLGFYGESLSSCASFLAPYLSVVFSLINYRCFRSFDKKCGGKGSSPPKSVTGAGQRYENPLDIGDRHVQMTNVMKSTQHTAVSSQGPHIRSWAGHQSTSSPQARYSNVAWTNPQYGNPPVAPYYQNGVDPNLAHNAAAYPSPSISAAQHTYDAVPGADASRQATNYGYNYTDTEPPPAYMI